MPKRGYKKYNNPFKGITEGKIKRAKEQFSS